MYYSIQDLNPSMENGHITMSGWGFNIKLLPEFKELVAKSEIDQKRADTATENMGRYWLDGCGYSRVYDPDNCGLDADPDKPPGPNARHAYRPGFGLSVTWGEWGPEHITVPGNACGLDLDRHSIGRPKNGGILSPHNVDIMAQAMLLLTVFCWFADSLWLEQSIKDEG